VRQRTHGEGEFIGVVRIAKEIHHKVARAHVVGQVRESFVPMSWITQPPHA
jgi:hypothetical protein